MAKLQQIKRSNGSMVHSINIPIEIIEELEWKKGDELNIVRETGTNYIIVERDDKDGSD